MPGHPLLLADALARNAREWGDDRAAHCVHTGRTFTWAQLERRAARAAQLFASLGVVNGERVAIWADNTHHYADVLYGAAKLGAPLVTLNYRLAPQEIAAIIDATAPKVLVVANRFEADLRTIAADLIVLSTDEFEAACALQPDGDPAPQRPVDPGDPCVVLFSSGTTGVPKGVTWSHRGAQTNALTYARTYELRRGQRMLMTTPLAATCGMLVIGVAAGCELVFGNFEGDATLSAIADTHTEVAILVPLMLARLCDAVERAPGTDISSLRDVIYGGAPISAALIERARTLLGCRLWQMYGMAETCLVGCVLGPEDHEDPRRLSSCGRPFDGVELRIVGTNGHELGPGEVGEIAIRTPGAMLGYWDAPELTAETIRDGWVYTGDLARTDADGYVHVVDRRKELIISGGFNLYPAEIEAVLTSHPDVAEAAVVGVPDDEWGESVYAYVVLERDGGASEADLVDHCRRHLGSAKKPRTVEFVPELPRNALGKVAKRALRARHWAGHERVV